MEICLVCLEVFLRCFVGVLFLKIFSECFWKAFGVFGGFGVVVGGF